MAATCTGWWEQSGLGRQTMTDLQLRFEGGRILGAGSDIIGAFSISGELHEGSVSLHKQYVNAHAVIYTGTFDGEGTLTGVWSIFGVGGRWLIRVLSDQRDTEIVDLF